jgi:hypothetical protein
MSFIINPYRLGTAAASDIDNCYYGATGGGTGDPANAGANQSIWYAGSIASFYDTGSSYQLRWYPNYAWKDDSGTTTRNDKPASTTVYIDYNTTPIQQCWLGGAPADTYYDNPFSGDPGSYSSLELPATSAEADNTADYLISRDHLDWDYRYLYIQYRIRAVSNSVTTTSDWWGTWANVEYIIEDQGTDVPSYGGTLTCYPTAVMTGNLCTPAGNASYVVAAPDVVSWTSGHYGVFDDGSGNYYCGLHTTDNEAIGDTITFWEEDANTNMESTGYPDCAECEGWLP